MPLTLLAIVAPAEIDAEVKQWKKYMQEEFGCEVALKSPAHITLIPPFNISKHKSTLLEQELIAFAAAYLDFTIHLKNFSAFAPRVIYVDVIKNHLLTTLKEDLEALLIKASYPVK